jgi:uncharacterized protein YcfL
MKKLTVIISIVLLILMLAGCGSPDNRQTAGVPRRIVSMSLDSDEILMGLVAARQDCRPVQSGRLSCILYPFRSRFGAWKNTE